jgi:IS5 family transposase
VYADTQRIFSSGLIAEALRENINFMWLSEMNRPDFRTIYRFREKIKKAAIDEEFYAVVEQLLEQGHIDLEKYFVDGIKIEANAHKYSFVWRKSTEKYKASLQEKVRALLDEIDELEAAEEAQYGDKDLEEVGEGKEIGTEKLKEVADKINQKLKKDPKNKTLKKAKRSLEKDFILCQEKYEEQGKTFQGSNSYSKTDNDESFMRMKEDHMLNGQLGTQNQFVIGYGIHQRAGDTGCLKPHLDHVRDWLGEYPESLIADAGYGSEEP